LLGRFLRSGRPLGAFKPSKRCGGRPPQHFWMVLKPPGAVETPRTDPQNSGQTAFRYPDIALETPNSIELKGLVTSSTPYNLSPSQMRCLAYTCIRFGAMDQAVLSHVWPTIGRKPKKTEYRIANEPLMPLLAPIRSLLAPIKPLLGPYWPLLAPIGPY
jgi:hypothetical protein